MVTNPTSAPPLIDSPRTKVRRNETKEPNVHTKEIHSQSSGDLKQLVTDDWQEELANQRFADDGNPNYK